MRRFRVPRENRILACMKYSIRAVLVALAMSVFSLAARAVEATWDYAVQVTASVQTSPASITLNWTQDTTATPSCVAATSTALRSTVSSGLIM